MSKRNVSQPRWFGDLSDAAIFPFSWARCPALSPEMRVLIRLAFRGYDTNGVSWTNENDPFEDIGLSSRRIDAILKILLQKGLIICHIEDDGQWHGDYKLVTEPIPAAYAKAHLGVCPSNTAAKS